MSARSPAQREPSREAMEAAETLRKAIMDLCTAQRGACFCLPAKTLPTLALTLDDFAAKAVYAERDDWQSRWEILARHLYDADDYIRAVNRDFPRIDVSRG